MRSVTGERLGLDFDKPARVEQRRDDAGRRGPGDRERVAVRAADLVDVRGARDVDPGAHDVVEARAGLGERARR